MLAISFPVYGVASLSLVKPGDFKLLVMSSSGICILGFGFDSLPFTDFLTIPSAAPPSRFRLAGVLRGLDFGIIGAGPFFSTFGGVGPALVSAALLVSLGNLLSECF